MLCYSQIGDFDHFYCLVFSLVLVMMSSFDDNDAEMKIFRERVRLCYANYEPGSAGFNMIVVLCNFPRWKPHFETNTTVCIFTSMSIG